MRVFLRSFQTHHYSWVVSDSLLGTGQPRLGEKGSEPKIMSHMFEFLMDLVMVPVFADTWNVFAAGWSWCLFKGGPGEGALLSQSWHYAWLH